MSFVFQKIVNVHRSINISILLQKNVKMKKKILKQAYMNIMAFFLKIVPKKQSQKTINAFVILYMGIIIMNKIKMEKIF